MKNFFSPFFLLISLAFSPGYAAFSSDYAGAAGAQFLKLGPGARAYGMAEAFSALADDASAVYWNPAGLAASEYTGASLTHSAMYEGINYEWLSYSFHTPFGAAAFGLQRLSYGDITARDISGNETGSIEPGDLCLSGAIAEKGNFEKNLSLGISLKYISSQISKKSSAYAVDAGARYDLSEKNSLSMVIQNFGSPLKYREHSDPLPFLLRFGFAHKPLAGMSFGADIISPSDGASWFAVGGEYSKKLGDSLTGLLRAGYGSSMKDVNGASGFSLGLGLGYSIYTFDYAYTPSGELGSISRLSLSASF